MDIDVFPNSLEYWGPTGMVFFRNVQVRWMPIKGDTSLVTLALERPGASGDQGVYADRIELQNVTAGFPLPDLSGHLPADRRSWGYVQVAGMLREDQVGRRHRRPVRPQRQRDRLGHQPQLEPEADQERRAAPAVGLRRGHPELHERLAGRHRHRQQLRQRGDADHRQADPDRRHRCSSSTTPGTEVDQRRSATRCRTTTTREGQAPTPSRPASTRSATCSTTPCPT